MPVPSTIVLQTSLSLEECRVRLAEAVDEERSTFLLASRYAGSKPILGKIRGDSFRLRYRIFYSNPSRPFFYGRFIPCQQATRIEGKFRLDPCTKWYFICWDAIAMLSLVSAVAHLIRDKGHFSGRGLNILIPIAMLVLGFTHIRFSQWLARGHQHIIVEFLKKTLSAELKTP